jgi:hypothetical protein
MVGGLIFTAMGVYVMIVSFEKGPLFSKMSVEEFENWRMKKKIPLRIVGIIMIIVGISQAIGLAALF